MARQVWTWLTGWYVRYAYYWMIILAAGAASIMGNRAARRSEELPSWAVDVIDGSPIVVLILMLHLIIVLGRHHGGSLWRSPAEVRALLDAPEPEWKALQWWNPRRWWLALHLDRLAVMGVAQIGGVVIATVALWVSYGQLRELALLADWSGLEASFFPLVVDAPAILATLGIALGHRDHEAEEAAVTVEDAECARPSEAAAQPVHESVHAVQGTVPSAPVAAESEALAPASDEDVQRMFLQVSESLARADAQEEAPVQASLHGIADTADLDLHEAPTAEEDAGAPVHDEGLSVQALAARVHESCNPAVSVQELCTVLERRAAGDSLRAIAEPLEVSPNSVRKWVGVAVEIDPDFAELVGAKS